MIFLKIPVVVLFALILSALAALACVIKAKEIDRIYPAFTLYVYVSLAKCCVIFGAYLFLGDTPYKLAYYVGAFIHAALVAVVVYEIYGNTFGPRIAVPTWVTRNVQYALAVVAVFSVMLGAVLRASNGGVATRIVITCEQVFIVASFLALVSMAVYSRRLGITWNKTVAEMWAGFVLFLAVNIAAVFMRADGGLFQIGIARRLGPISYIVALAWWNWRLARAELQRPVLSTLSYHRRDTVARG